MYTLSLLTSQYSQSIFSRDGFGALLMIVERTASAASRSALGHRVSCDAMKFVIPDGYIVTVDRGDVTM